jgi:hypothetical protein
MSMKTRRHRRPHASIRREEHMAISGEKNTWPAGDTKRTEWPYLAPAPRGDSSSSRRGCVGRDLMMRPPHRERDDRRRARAPGHAHHLFWRRGIELIWACRRHPHTFYPKKQNFNVWKDFTYVRREKLNLHEYKNEMPPSFRRRLSEERNTRPIGEQDEVATPCNSLPRLRLSPKSKSHAVCDKGLVLIEKEKGLEIWEWFKFLEGGRR